MNTFLHHIPFRQMADYIEGDMPLVKRVELEAHIADCSRCSHKLAKLERSIRLMRTDLAQDAPAAVIHRAKHLFRSGTAIAPASSGLHRSVLAALKFDSLGLAPAFGVRSTKPDTRQLLFGAGPHEIDLRIEPAGGTWTVSGQILGESVPHGKVVLQGATGSSETVLNELSEFVLPPVQAGTYKLILHLPDVDVEIDEIRIGS